MDVLPSILLLSVLIISFSVPKSCSAADTISFNETLTDGQTLVSSGQSFELGFFSPSGSSSNRYLGIWYKSFPDTPVWVANRESPVSHSYGVLTVSADGNLVLLNNTIPSSVIWSSNSSRTVLNSVAQLLDTGNLVLKDSTNMNPDSYIWQSFDFPTDTLLPGMKLGWNLPSGLNLYLTSWKTTSDPSRGDYTYGIEISGLPQGVIRRGSVKTFRSGIWNGLRFSGSFSFPSTLYKSIFVANNDEIYYVFHLHDNSISTKVAVKQSGLIQRLILNKGSSEWTVMNSSPRDACDDYGQCGANGICRSDRKTICECLAGFIPKSESQWAISDWSSGCTRRRPLDCQKGDGFVKLKNVKLPDLDFWHNESMNLEQCKAECLNNCSCMAVTNLDFKGRGGGCIMWFGDLMDIRELVVPGSKQDMYIRMPASELDHNQKGKRRMLILFLSGGSASITFSLLTCCMICRRRKKSGKQSCPPLTNKFKASETDKEEIELPMHDLATVTTATSNFSSSNMIGKGGFGSVYKGKLLNGQEIAVKRLSRTSRQGLKEFKNEIILISKLQHRNLVGLLGCCLEGEEKMLVYEYMPNKSLDYFIFDQHRRVSLMWQNRFKIAMGIAKGLLYLHQDSKLRIIHRDLKASNVLLDSSLNPKISDFGIAKTFGGDQVVGETKHIVGTYGYMSPEYVVDGNFSEKSDVFSFGVILLEIVSGKRNTRYHHPDHYHSLLGHAWLLWNEEKAIELMDSCLEDSYVESQVLACIQVGLLCVQKLPKDRPEMSSVVFMLGNKGVTLPEPQQPGFFIERSSIEMGNSERCPCSNAGTMTMPEARW